MTVHGEDGLDEISVCARTRVVEVDETGRRTEYTLTPEEFGIPRYPIDGLLGGTVAENARTAIEVLGGGGPEAIREAVLLNAGAALYICGMSRNIGDGYKLAREALATGRAAEKLEQVRATSKRAAVAA
jgi:anthranilate synthase/phosphoribosyltransferase